MPRAMHRPKTAKTPHHRKKTTKTAREKITDEKTNQKSFRPCVQASYPD